MTIVSNPSIAVAAKQIRNTAHCFLLIGIVLNISRTSRATISLSSIAFSLTSIRQSPNAFWAECFLEQEVYSVALEPVTDTHSQQPLCLATGRRWDQRDLRLLRRAAGFQEFGREIDVGSLREEIRRIEMDRAIYRACIRGTDLPVRVDVGRAGKQEWRDEIASVGLVVVE